MDKKSSKTTKPDAAQGKKSSGPGAKLGIFLCVLAAAILGFAVAEHQGLTGTQFLFKNESAAEENIAGKEKSSRESGQDARTEDAAAKEEKPDARNDNPTDNEPGKKSRNDSGKKKSTAKKSPAKKSAASGEPLPLHAFIDISRKPHTWPGFIRLTRSRTISMTDARTGESMGRMEVPSGTVVKVFKVLPTGTLEVMDRTGQKFKVEASGTNFAAAYALVKNKPKKKSKPKKTVAKKPEKPIEAPKPETPVAAVKKEKPASTPVMSAFGVAIDDSEDDGWEEDFDEE